MEKTKDDLATKLLKRSERIRTGMAGEISIRCLTLAASRQLSSYSMDSRGSALPILRTPGY